MSNYPNLLTPPSDSPESSLYTMSSPSSTSTSPPRNCNHVIPPQYTFIGGHGFVVHNDPYLQVTEEPTDRFRFRYKSEMSGTHGSLTGKNSDRSRKQTFPSVELYNFNRPAIIRCSLYQHSSDNMKDTRQPHAHRLVKKITCEEIDDPHSINVNAEIGYVASFHSMGIIHTAKKNIVTELVRKKALLKKEEIARKEGVARDLTKKEEVEIRAAAEADSKSINLNTVCLRFDAFEERNGILIPLSAPVYSNSINNLKSALTGDLKIVRIDHCSSPSRGGREVFILVEKVTKKNIKIRFFELDDDENIIWEDYGKFNELDVHHQYAIVFKTPPYKHLDIDKSVSVFIELLRPSDGARSEPKEFNYTPSDSISRKRARSSYNSYSSSAFASDELPLPVTNIHPNVFSNDNLDQYMMINPVPVVNSAELEAALKLKNINSDEFDRVCDTLLGSEFHRLYASEDIEFNNLSITTDSPWKMSSAELSSAAKSKITFSECNRINTRDVDESDKRLLGNVQEQLIPFLKTKPTNERMISMLKSLFEKNISKNGDGPLHLAIASGHKLLPIILKLVLKFQLTCMVNKQNGDGETPVHIAAYCNNLWAVEHLLVSKADVTVQDDDGNTALHIAVMRNVSMPLLKLLLTNNAKNYIDLENNEGNTALHIAVKTNNLPAVKLICWNGSDVNKCHKKNGWTALHVAVAEQNVKILNFLLDSTEMQPQKTDFRGDCPLKLAKVLIQDDKPKTTTIFKILEQHLKKIGVFVDVNIKEEIEEFSEEEMDIDFKCEPMSPVMLDKQEPEFAENCLEEISNILDKSGTWQNLAELLDYGHLLRTKMFSSFKSPSKSLLTYSVTNGDSLQQIRDFLENLDEVKAVEVMDRMLKNHMTF